MDMEAGARASPYRRTRMTARPGRAASAGRRVPARRRAESITQQGLRAVRADFVRLPHGMLQPPGSGGRRRGGRVAAHGAPAGALACSRDPAPGHARRPRVRELPDRRRARGRRRRGRPAAGDRRVPPPRPLPRRGDRPRAGDAHARRPRVRPRPARRRHRRDDPRAPRRRGAGYAHEPFDDGWVLELGGLRDRGAAHAGPPARAHRLPAHGHRAAATSRGRC